MMEGELDESKIGINDEDANLVDQEGRLKGFFLHYCLCTML